MEQHSPDGKSCYIEKNGGVWRVFFYGITIELPYGTRALARDLINEMKAGLPRILTVTGPDPDQTEIAILVESRKWNKTVRKLIGSELGDPCDVPAELTQAADRTDPRRDALVSAYVKEQRVRLIDAVRGKTLPAAIAAVFDLRMRVYSEFLDRSRPGLESKAGRDGASILAGFQAGDREKLGGEDASARASEIVLRELRAIGQSPLPSSGADRAPEQGHHLRDIHRRRSPSYHVCCDALYRNWKQNITVFDFEWNPIFSLPGYDHKEDVLWAILDIMESVRAKAYEHGVHDARRDMRKALGCD